MRIQLLPALAYLAASLAFTAPVILGCGDMDPGVDESDLVAGGLALTKVKSAAQYDSIAFEDGGVILPGKSVKFLIDNRAPSAKKIFYMNAKFESPDGSTPDAARFHYPFAQKVLKNFNESLGGFNEATYSTQDKKYFAGTIQTYRMGDDEHVVYGIQFYPEDVASEDRILDAVKTVKKSFTIPGEKLAFVATGPQQTTATIATALKNLGVLNLTIDQVLGDIKYIPLNQGEAWGYLRIFPKDQNDLSPLDIAVFDELPLDLTVVAGVITKAFQDVSCHINLKSKERGTPDMVLRDAGPSQELLSKFADKPVHLTVGPSSFEMEASTDAEVKKKLAEKLDKPWTALPYAAASAPLGYSEMCSSSASTCLGLAKKFGSKGANLGFMTNSKVLGRVSDASSLSHSFGYDLVPGGIGVPLKFYRDFVDLPANAELKSKIAALVDAEKAGTLSGSQRLAMLKEVQQGFYTAEFPAGMVDKIKTKLTAVLPGVDKLKVRSAANAEDVPYFDGAGLYDSFSANLTKTDNADGSCIVKSSAEGEGVETKLEVSPKTLACAIKGVYASVWNKRAIEERSYARLDHGTAFMGLAIVTKYDLVHEVSANSVVVTRVINADDTYGYTFASQVGNNLVTNPTPGTLPESAIAAFVDDPPSFIVTRYATPTKGAPQLTKTVLSVDQMKTMLKITQTVETAYCKAKPGYYPGGDCNFVTLDTAKPTALDFEFKILDDGHFVAKQVREFSGH